AVPTLPLGTAVGPSIGDSRPEMRMASIVHPRRQWHRSARDRECHMLPFDWLPPIVPPRKPAADVKLERISPRRWRFELQRQVDVCHLIAFPTGPKVAALLRSDVIYFELQPIDPEHAGIISNHVQ